MKLFFKHFIKPILPKLRLEAAVIIAAALLMPFFVGYLAEEAATVHGNMYMRGLFLIVLSVSVSLFIPTMCVVAAGLFWLLWELGDSAMTWLHFAWQDYRKERDGQGKS